MTEEAQSDLARALRRRSAPDELQFRRARWLSSAIVFKERPFDSRWSLRVTIPPRRTQKASLVPQPHPGREKRVGWSNLH